MKKPLIIALLVGTLANPAFGQFNQFGGGQFGGGPFAGQQQGGFPGVQQQFGGQNYGGGFSPYQNPASSMGWLASPYSQMGGPVMGAQNYQNQYLQQAGSGMNMVNQCPYAQAQYSDPLDKDPIVAEAKEKLRDLVLDKPKLKDELTDAQEDLRQAKAKLKKDILSGDADGFLAMAVACRKFANETLKNYTDPTTAPDTTKPGTTKPASDTDVQKAWLGQFAHIPGISDDSSKTACYQATKGIQDKSSGDMNPALLCLDVPLNVYKQGKDYKNPEEGKAPDVVFKSAANAGSGCQRSIGAALAAQEKVDEIRKKLDDLQDKEKQADRDYVNAKRDLQRENSRNSDDKYAQDAGIPASIQGCAGCIQMWQAQQVPQGPSKTQILTGAAVGAGLAYLSIASSYSLKQQILNRGFIPNPNTSSGGAIWGNGIANGLSAGLPFMQSGLYGQTPGGGYSQGGYGCAQTVNGSQFLQPQGAFANGPYNGAYYPGAAYMPGAGNWGVNNVPGMYPPMYPGGGNGYFPGGGNGYFPGGGGGGFNPYAMQMQQQQQQMQMAYMNQQMQDQMRADQAGMYAIGYGLNNANQQYSYASQLMAGNSGFGGGNFYNGGGGNYFNGGGGGFNNYMAGNYAGGYAPGPCGGGLLSTSVQICGHINLGGGSYGPTYSNSAFGNQYQYPQTFR